MITSDGTLLFTSNGSEWNPKIQKLLGTFPLTIENASAIPFASSLFPSSQTEPIYYLGDQPYGTSSIPLVLSAYDKQTFKLVGALRFDQSTWPAVSNLNRWGNNGFSFIAPGTNLTDQEIYILRSSLSGNETTNPLPVAGTLSPSSIMAGGSAFTLTVNGSGFIPNSIVNWNGSALPTTYVNGTQLTAAIPAADLANAGTAQVSIQNPPVGGGTSSNLVFAITTPSTLKLSATTLAFGNESIGLASPASTVTLTNSGGQTIILSGIVASPQFSQTNNCGSTLLPSTACQIEVVFTPASAGSQTGTLTLTDNAVSSPQTIVLSGSGVNSAVTIGAATGGSTSATVTSGGTATYNLSLTGSPGLTGTVTLACSKVPTGTTCTVNPATLTLADGQSSSFTVSINTAASTSTAQLEKTLLIGGIGLCSLVMLPLSRKRRRVRDLLLCVILLSACVGLGALSGCGGGSSSSTLPPAPGLATGSYSIEITATAGSVSATQALSLTVK